MTLRLAQLDAIAPRFKVPAKAVQILTQPEDFYSELKERILKARKRIFLATLYIGTSQHELVQVLDESLTRNNELDLHILTDGFRGTREAPEPCTASLLSPLVAKYPSRVHISLYQTPKLSGIKQLLLPKRINEGWGLQHMKLYGIDDEIILSGANLSSDYFTNRQDRYVSVADRRVTDYFYKVFQAVAGLSYSVKPSINRAGFELEWTSTAPHPHKDPQGFYDAAKQRLVPLLQPFASSKKGHQSGQAVEHSGDKAVEDSDAALVYPVCQFTQLLGNKYSTELPVVKTIATALETGRYSWALTAGYFNVSDELQKLLFKSRPEEAVVITAGAKANGFYQSSGISKHIPGLYSYLAREFLLKAEKLNLPITMLEWQRGVVNDPEGWSYHAKGIWLRKEGDENPFLTVIGSSNFTRRAYTHDLEAGAVIVTSNSTLQASLGAELANLRSHTTPISARDYPRPSVAQRVFVSWLGDKL